MAKKRAKNSASEGSAGRSTGTAAVDKTTPLKIPAKQLAGLKKMFLGRIPAAAMEQIEQEYQRNPTGAFERCVTKVKQGGGAFSPSGVCAAAGRKKYGAKKFQAMAAAGKRRASRSNPVDAAADKYAEFHGKDPEVITEIETPIHEHGTLSGIGKLVQLTILAIDGRNVVDVKNFRGALLAQDENGLQLFIVGGDQKVNLSDFGINTPHEQEVLGAVQEVWYDTEKTHLRPADGGKAVYRHKFGGKKTRLPLMVYDVRNKLLTFAGGQYDMPEVGIRG